MRWSMSRCHPYGLSREPREELTGLTYPSDLPVRVFAEPCLRTPRRGDRVRTPVPIQRGETKEWQAYGTHWG